MTTLMGDLQKRIEDAVGSTGTFDESLQKLANLYGIAPSSNPSRIIPVAADFDSSITTAPAALNYLLYNPDKLPTLGLDFINNTTLDSRITFTRALNTATYFNSAGLLTTADANVPRFDYDPVTLAPRGLLIEEARTNLLTYSEAASTSPWNLINITASVDTAVAPDGATTADTLTEGVGAQIQFANTQVQTIVSGQTVTLSRYVKRGTGVLRGFRLECEGGANGFRANFNPDTGAVSSSSAFGAGVVLSSGSEPAANGFRRYYVTGTLGTSTSITNYFRFTQTPTSPTIGYTGDGIQSFEVWGAQLEAGAFATSYIPTVASQVTRNADVASVNTLTPWYNATEGTLYAEYDAYAPLSGAAFGVAALNDGTASNRTYLFLGGGTASPSLIVTSAGAAQANINNSAISANTTAKTAGTYAVNDFAIATNAGTVATDVSGALPVGLSKLDLGGFLSGAFLNGHLRRITYYPRRLSNAELQSITS